MIRTLKGLVALLIVVALVKPALLDSVVHSASGALHASGQDIRFTRAGQKTSGTAVEQAPNYGTTAQRASATAKPIGTLGAHFGESHHTEIMPGYRWSSCSPVRFLLNTRHAPQGAIADFKTALAKINGATRLHLEVVGTTRMTPTASWADSQGQANYRPVLVSWVRAGTSILDAGASGTSSPKGVMNSAGQKVLVSGQIAFSIANDHLYPRGFGASGSRVLLDMHEVGHILGLDHVKDANQMMYPSVAGVIDAGAGDIAGLRQAGDGGCMSVPQP